MRQEQAATQKKDSVNKRALKIKNLTETFEKFSFSSLETPLERAKREDLQN